MPRIFIAYRRQDNKFFQNAVYQEMAKRFGANSVVRDVDNIPVGADFRKYLQDEVARCHALLAVIGDRWLPLLQGQVNKDIDFLRLEIESALARDIPVVPVLVGGAQMPPKSALPPSMAPLVYRQGVKVRKKTLDADLKDLVARLKAAFDPANQPSAKQRRSGAHDLALRVSAKPKSGEIGILFTWTVTVRNDGTEDLRQITVRRGRRILAGPFDLASGKGRRFTFGTRYEKHGQKTNSVSAAGIDANGERFKIATRLAVRVV